MKSFSLLLIASTSLLSLISYPNLLYADSDEIKTPWCEHPIDTHFSIYGAAYDTLTKTFIKTDTISKSTPPNKVSLKCLSCHDGVNAASRPINLPGSGGYYPTSSYTKNINDEEIDITELNLDNLSQNRSLVNGHPVAVKYIEGVAVLKNINTKIYGWDNADTIEDLLVDGTIQCISCHNTHKQNPDKYLRHKNKGSALCLSCHNR
ncbi:cytochrome c3 family protein [Candidatus Sulfurimonas marisnigri]|uniref:Cytochrome c3 family protein n=1 Tax=Candidatus Sulfurimonas marisnigri TaxID=2740405 RepID=A0A7S7RPP0_9BACT|nr:cytochrome c3 family protein [Candidatus Sulfurimonas marisnigri]QOY53728.1 cytochrome c3 family protein [Candidatus Sulfurimonas marisnigri]